MKNHEISFNQVDFVETMMADADDTERLATLEKWLMDATGDDRHPDTRRFYLERIQAYLVMREQEDNELREKVRKFRKGKDGVY